MSDYYILEGKETIPSDLMTWAEFMGKENRIVKSDVIEGAHVSTVFLGLDHQFGSKGKPILFETMIFGGEHDGYQERYHTWEDAEVGHEVAANLAKTLKDKQ